MKRSIAVCCSLALAGGFYGAAVHAAPAGKMKMKGTLMAHLSGMNEVGAHGAMNGKGTAKITINMAKSRLCYTLSVSGFKLPALAAHIHAGKAGKNGNVVVPFPTAPGKTGMAMGCVHVKAMVLKAIEGHPSSYYVNVHTAAYPAGAVRGQLM